MPILPIATICVTAVWVSLIWAKAYGVSRISQSEAAKHVADMHAECVRISVEAQQEHLREEAIRDMARREDDD